LRKHLIWCSALAFAVAFSATGVAIAADTGNNHSSVSQKVKPSKLPKSKQKPIKLTVEVTTLVNGDSGDAFHPTKFPSPSTQTNVSFDKDMKFNTKGVATCKQSQIDGTTQQQALNVCKKANVGPAPRWPAPATAPAGARLS